MFNRQRCTLVSAALTAATLVSCNPNMQNAPTLHPAPANAADRMAREYLVSVHPGTDHATVRELYKAYGVRNIVDVSPNLFLVTLERDPGLERIKHEGLASQKIKSVEPNLRYRAQ